MYFNSMQYAMFLSIVFIIYYILPQKIKYLWLLGVSYYFYMCWNAKYALLMLSVTIITWSGAIILDKLSASNQTRFRKVCLFTVIIINFGLLFYFKYINFAITNINRLLHKIGHTEISTLEIILPVGISFFVFQATGYIIDVYRNEIYAEKKFFRYALFISFFPQLVAGPIERSKNLLKQLAIPAKLDGENIRTGLIYILFGIWQKVFLADNIARIVNKVYNDYTNFSGIQIFLATVLFGIEIYCDFGGYTNIAIGSARLLGVRLMQNFVSPYLAISVSDFWRRWHISLTSWFRDYLYIPLGGNRKGTIRKYINTLIIFLASGVWHGAGWSYIIWGTLNGMYIILENIFHKKKNVTHNAIEKWMMRAGTFLLVDFTWLFFRAGSASSAINMIRHAFAHPGIRDMLLGNAFSLFESYQAILITLFGLMLLLVIGIFRENTHQGIVSLFFAQKEPLRWMLYLTLTLMIILYGVYGEGYEQTQFIYFQF
ncbi:MAG: MBOAT family protein [Lachnospiraceae bacterium]|nr:MBOAT family protein [Lachnospiraceae bacterium]MCM1237835.1 MBOAT family protein [Lachnospiraceae bacterium]